jgi:hypothetical protein
MNEDKELIGKGSHNMLFSRNGTIKEMDFLMKPSDLVSTHLYKPGQKMLQGYDQGTFVGFNKDMSIDEFVAHSMAVFSTGPEGTTLKVRQHIEGPDA